MSQINSQLLIEKHKDVIDHPDYAPIKDPIKRATMAQLIENQIKDGYDRPKILGKMLNEADVPSNVSANFGGPNSNNTTNISGYDPILVNMVRRAMPNLIAYDVCGVQAMDMPTGLMFALRAKEITSAPDTDLNGNNELFYNEPSGLSGKTSPTGTTPFALNTPTPTAFTAGDAYSTLEGEQLGSAQGTPWKEVGVTIEKISVEATTHALKAQFSEEMATDLKNVHNMDAKSLFNQIMTSQIIADINRRVIRTIYVTAKKGAANTTVPGVYDTVADSDGRHFVERMKSMMFQLDRESNQIAKETRMGRGNFIICSADVASALSAAGVLDVPLDVSRGQLEVDDTGNTFAGVLNGRYKVFVDPYAVTADGSGNYAVVGYRGSSPLDAGLFYLPYVPLQWAEARDPATLQMVIGCKQRYALKSHPFANGTTRGLGALTANANVYYRRINILNLEG